MLSSHQRNRVYAVVVTAVLLGAAALVASPGLEDAGESVSTALVAERVLRPSVLASGQLAHEEQVELTSEVAGRVAAIHVREGERVRRSNVVLSIDSDAYRARVKHNRAAVRLEKIELERQDLRINTLQRHHDRSALLFERDLLDAHSLEVARHELDLAHIDLASRAERLVQARARLQQSENEFEKTRIRAPIDGVVTALDIDVGETAIPSSTNIPGSRLMTIANPARVVAEVHVDEADIGAVVPGQTAQIVAVAHPDRPLDAVVEFVANTAKTQRNRAGLSFLVRIRIGPTDGIGLRPGMSCRAEIFTGASDAVLAAPIQAIVAEEQPGAAARQFAYVVRQGIVRKVPVRVGRSDDTYQEISSGVRAGDRVVTGPGRTLRNLRDGDAVHEDGEAMHEKAPPATAPEPTRA